MGVFARHQVVGGRRHAWGGGVHIGPRGVFGRLLRGRVQRGLDGVATRSDLFPAVALVGEPFEHVVAEEARAIGTNAAILRNSRLVLDDQRFLGELVCLLLLQGSRCHAGLEHVVAPSKRALRIGVRVQSAGGLHDSGQERRLGVVEVGGVHPKVGLCGGLHAVGPVSERHEVEVAGENLVFVELFIQLGGHLHFAKLARDRGFDSRVLLRFALRTDEPQVVFHVLLVQRGCAFFHSTAGEVGHRCAQRAAQVHTTVFVEAPILDRHDAVFHRLRNLVGRNFGAVLFVEPS